MRKVKHLIIGFVALGLLIFLISLLFSSSIKVNRDITINATPREVHAILSKLNSWPLWYSSLTDSTSSSATTGKSIVYTQNQLKWFDENQNLNTITIAVVDSLQIEATLSSSKGKELKSRFIIHPIDNGAHARVEWQCLVELGWLPWNKLSGMFTEKMIAPAQEQSLANLKSLLEQTSVTKL